MLIQILQIDQKVIFYAMYMLLSIITSLSSHPWELPFGRIREGSIGNDTTEMVSNIIAKRIIRYHLLDNLGHNESAVKGICENARSSFSQGWNIDIPKEIDCSKIQNEIM